MYLIYESKKNNTGKSSVSWLEIYIFEKQKHCNLFMLILNFEGYIIYIDRP